MFLFCSCKEIVFRFDANFGFESSNNIFEIAFPECYTDDGDDDDD